jgi:hypothetical protein
MLITTLPLVALDSIRPTSIRRSRDRTSAGTSFATSRSCHGLVSVEYDLIDSFPHTNQTILQTAAALFQDCPKLPRITVFTAGG